MPITKPRPKGELARVAKAAAAQKRARERLEESIRGASEAGAPLRAIAEVSGFTHEGVRRILRR